MDIRAPFGYFRKTTVAKYQLKIEPPFLFKPYAPLSKPLLIEYFLH